MLSSYIQNRNCVHCLMNKCANEKSNKICINKNIKICINKNISKEVIKSAWNNSVTCPQQSETLVSILKACELKDINKYKFNIALQLK